MPPKRHRRFTPPFLFGLGWLSIVAVVGPPAAAQDAGGNRLRRPMDANVIDAAPPQDLVELNLDGSVSLQQLVEALSRQIDVRFLYGADLGDQKVNVYTPTRLPRSALPALLGALLKGEGLAVVDSEVPGWKRIVNVQRAGQFTRGLDADESFDDVVDRDGPAAAVTRVIPIRYADVSQIATALKSFLSDGSNLITLADSRLVIATDYADNVRRVSELIDVIDTPGRRVVLELYPTRRRSPQSLIEQVQRLTGDGKDADTGDVRLYADAAGRRVAVAGPSERVRETLDLLKRLDSGADDQTKLYRIENVPAARIETLIGQLIGTDDGEDDRARVSVDPEGNLLVVRAPEAVHAQILRLIEQIDRPVDADESPIRFYKLKNAQAAEVLYSLLSLQQATTLTAGGVVPASGFGFGFGGFGVGGVGNPALVNPALGNPALVNPALGFGGGASGFGINPGLATGGLPTGTLGTAGLGLGSLGAGAALGGTGGRAVGMPFNDGNVDGLSTSAGRNANTGVRTAGALGGFIGGGAGIPGGVATLPGGARVSADVATNSIIVVAPSSVQPLYEKLILSLDQRRPQVMIEAVIVAIDTSDDFRLGVEISGGDRTGASRLFEFTSFGLSEVDPADGSLTVVPNLGFNGVLIDPDVADVIVQALSTHTRGQVLASPKVLVNDNQTGALESVTSVPFQSINTINTISSQSLGGNQQAGTVITVTPHINEGDHLQLEFEVEFSTFTGTGTATLPPPRQVDRVGSVVTIPDGQTIIVGGLKRTEVAESFAGVPVLEKIPLVRELTSLRTADESTTSFFLFLRPRILRDSRFADLRYLSDVESATAGLPGDYPTSGPILIPGPRAMPVPATPASVCP